jgi:Tfp pilus assembly protein PilE
MGQQQLLLVILVTIIVGIATVVAINTFGAAADSANLDAVRQDVASIAASAQGYFMKPSMLGGGGNSFNSPNITFDNIAFAANEVSSDGLTAVNENGVYVISGHAASSFTVTAHPASAIDGAVTLSSTAPSDDQLTATVEPDNMSFTN